ncbi:MAG: CDP-alcohol phosphatidyltransferase family protein [Planctomycetota bacterium]
MTLANRITIARILLLPVFVILVLEVAGAEAEGDSFFRYCAAGLFALMAIGDALDGYFARRRNERTDLGRILDPLADKLLLDTTCVLLASRHWVEPRLPFWVPVVVISRDGFILLGCVVIFFLRGRLDVRPSIVGKLTTVFQILLIAAAFFAPDGLISRKTLETMAWIVVSLTVLSGVDYMYASARHLAEHENTGNE